MSELPPPVTSACAAAQNIATAPGDLPHAEIVARAALQRTQFRHDNTIVPLAPRPAMPVEVWATSGEEVRLDGAAVYYTVDGRMPDPHAALARMDIAQVDWDGHAGYLTRWRAIIPAQPAGATIRYRIGGWRSAAGRGDTEPDLWAHDGQGFWFRVAGEQGITTFAYTAEPPAPPMPAWLDGAAIYHIFLDRFHPGTPGGVFRAGAGPRESHGGTLRGVRQALPYLRDLGVTCLWLSPFCTAPSYHRYDAVDFRSVDPALGTNADLRDLTKAAHALGMRVLMDFVPSHCSSQHPAFRAAQLDRSAPTASWFTFDHWPDRYRCFLGHVPSLPSFNTDDPGARAYLIESAVLWAREYLIDGFRLDHAIGPSMDFWVAFRQALRAVRPDLFTVGEVTDTPDCLRRYRGRLDAVLDFPLARALRHTFARGDWGVARLDTFLRAYTRYMADGPGRVSFLDNHDMDRFLFVAGGETRRLQLAALCQFTLEPVPAIYYGTEVGLSQEAGLDEAGFGGDAQARRDMIWDSARWDWDLLSFYRRLIELRRTHPALRSGGRRTIHLDETTATYAYLREIEGDREMEAEAILVLFNLGDRAGHISLPAGGGAATCRCLLAAGEEPRLAGTHALSAELAPWSGAALAVAHKVRSS